MNTFDVCVIVVIVNFVWLVIGSKITERFPRVLDWIGGDKYPGFRDSVRGAIVFSPLVMAAIIVGFFVYWLLIEEI